VALEPLVWLSSQSVHTTKLATLGALGTDVSRPAAMGTMLTANPKSISYRCSLREVAFERELTEETIYLPLGCLQGGGADVSRPAAMATIFTLRRAWVRVEGLNPVQGLGFLV
jgi:hypothetical protein